MMTFKACMKWLFYLMNGLLFILGLGSLGVGVWMAVDAQSFLDLTKLGDLETVSPDLVRVSGYIMISAGGATTLLSLLGIIGAYRDSFCLLGMYVVFLVLALAVQVSAVVLGVIFRKQIESTLDDKLMKKITQEYDGPGDRGNAFSSALNTFMSEVECCGVRNATEEFRTAKKWTSRTSVNVTHILPMECCRDNLDCTSAPSANNSFQEGCLTKVHDLLYKYHAVVIGVSVGVVGFQFLLVVLGMCMFSQKRPSYTVDLK